MNHLEPYKLFEEVNDMDIGFELTDIFAKLPEDAEDPVYKRMLDVAKEGKMYKYLATGQRQLTFGMLKALHQDAIDFKKKRELKQGIDKFLWRIVPLVLAPVFFPLWIISQALGSVRALNKILVQVLKMDNKEYNKFIMNIVTKTMDITEGEFERVLKEDWFYKSFAVEKGLINMTRKEHIIEFAYHIAKKIQYQDDFAVVTPYYIENEFRRFLNKKFRINPPLPLKIDRKFLPRRKQ